MSWTLKTCPDDKKEIILNQTCHYPYRFHYPLMMILNINIHSEEFNARRKFVEIS